VSRAPHDIAGEQYGPYTAIRFLRIDKARKSVWEFRCECGALSLKRRDQIEHGIGRDCPSCGRSLKHDRPPPAQQRVANSRFYCEADRRHGR
jgi:hypothetical protein